MAGLVAITPAAGFVGPLSALIIGLAAGVLCYFAIFLKHKLGYDDALDVVGVHGVGGTFGALATGLFASKPSMRPGITACFSATRRPLGIQAIAVGVTLVYSFVVTLIILKVLDWTMGLRVEHEDEMAGLDISQHSEVGYNL